MFSLSNSKSTSSPTDARSQASDQALAAGANKGSVAHVTFGDKPFYNGSSATPLWALIAAGLAVYLLTSPAARRTMKKIFNGKKK